MKANKKNVLLSGVPLPKQTREVSQLEARVKRELAERDPSTRGSSDAPSQMQQVHGGAIEKLRGAAKLTDSPVEWLKLAAGNDCQDKLLGLLDKLFGIEGRSLAAILFAQSGLVSSSSNDSNSSLLYALEAVSSLAPVGGMQAMLAVQMVGVHFAAARSLASLSSGNGNADTGINNATKLMRLFAQQTELMARLQGKITQQRIVVEKVDVRDGGQAVIGAVEAGGGYGGRHEN